MKKQMLRTMSLMLCLVMLCSSMLGTAVFAAEKKDGGQRTELVQSVSLDAMNGKVSNVSGTCGKNLTWTLKNGVLTISGTGSMYDYDFFSAPWFEYRENITAVKIGKNVTTIGVYAFNNCFNLKSITIPGNVKKIGEYAFLYCNNLKNVTIEDGVVSIEDAAFFECYQITSIILPDSISKIGESAFWNCRLKTITFPPNVMVIGDHAFGSVDYNTLKKIIFKGNPPEFASEAFYMVTANAYYPANNSFWTPKVMKDYGGDITWIKKCVVHELVIVHGKKAECGKTGLTDGKKCSICGTVVVKQNVIPATGKHTYTDKYDSTCNACNYVREDFASVPMHRMYDPNSSEHFYTGSEEEVNILVKAGWNYEGVGFNFPAEGKPVHRLYHKPTGEHLYTMSEEEKSTLLAKGWKYEGVAFNSAGSKEIPQYRLHNPNATRGAYHFTGSAEERDHLMSLGWEYQGIGWYSCLK